MDRQQLLPYCASLASSNLTRTSGRTRITSSAPHSCRSCQRVHVVRPGDRADVFWSRTPSSRLSFVKSSRPQNIGCLVTKSQTDSIQDTWEIPRSSNCAKLIPFSWFNGWKGRNSAQLEDPDMVSQCLPVCVSSGKSWSQSSKAWNSACLSSFSGRTSHNHQRLANSVCLSLIYIID